LISRVFSGDFARNISARNTERTIKRIFGLALATSALCCGAASAQVSDGVVKLDVLNDMSSLYADIGSKGSVLAAQMPVEDFGGKVLGAPIEIVSGHHKNKPTSGPASRESGSSARPDVLFDRPAAERSILFRQARRSVPMCRSNKQCIVPGLRLQPT